MLDVLSHDLYGLVDFALTALALLCNGLLSLAFLANECTVDHMFLYTFFFLQSVAIKLSLLSPWLEKQ